LAETGYRFCRVSYRSVSVRLRERMLGRELDTPVDRECIAGITCVRLNTPGGFADATCDMLARCAREGGMMVAYAHPHSLASGNSQDERWLTPFLARLRDLQQAGSIRVRLPRDLG
jgi:hypothetical protein